MKIKVTSAIKSVLNTYAILFFSQNALLGAILLVVSFLNPIAGFSGLACTIFSLIITQVMGYRKEIIHAGIYSFNSLLMGFAFGSFFSFNAYYVVWLLFGSLMVVMITIILEERLTGLGLPILSFPFIISFWLIVLAANSAFNTWLYHSKSDYWLHDAHIDTFPAYINLFFRSVSAIIFQDNVFCGILITIGLFFHSRIAFSLFIISFITACIFNETTHVFPGGISYYDLGANFMMTSVAAGSFLTIPSARSYLWAILCIPLVFILISAFTGLLALHGLPVLSLPFSVIIITLLYFLRLRKSPGKLQLVQLQHYSPERNLYQFINLQKRLDDLKYFRIQLPFMGSWTVSQGYDGTITHKADWSKALDFVIENEDNKTFKLPGTLPEHFYCFNKPVLACGDGIVANVINHIDDNPIGETNTQENWGNTVVIKHLNGLHSKVSHLKKGSVKVKTGAFVKQGDLIGMCGNSGHSPEPHLHFQMQATPYIDAKTLPYPFACYLKENQKKELLNLFQIPDEGQTIKPVTLYHPIKKAFDFQPGYSAKLKAANGKEETIEVYTDELNQSYFYCEETGDVAYFINDGNMFYFTSYYGDGKSLLYYLYLAAFKIIFIESADIMVNDLYPLQLTGGNLLKRWLQDLVSPFYRFIKLEYQSIHHRQNAGVILYSSQTERLFGKEKKLMDAEMVVTNNNIEHYTVKLNGKDFQVEWQKQNTY